jgi:hypothetical protein
MSNRFIACTLLVLLAGCAVQRVGEFGDACTNGKDDDGDHLIDCNDPDCLGVEACRPEGGMVKMMPRADAGLSTTRDAGNAFDAASDTGGSHAMDAARDSGLVMPFDANALDEDGSSPTCSPPCNPDEECVVSATSLHCQAVAAKQEGAFKLQVTSARAPNQSGVTAFCYDGDCPPAFAPLCCVVDPYVRIVLVPSTGGPEKVLGMTPSVMDSTHPTFDAPAIPVTLTMGDVLRFEVWDHNDPPVMDLLLFQCKPDLTTIPGPLSCSTVVGITTVEVNADLQAGP